MKLVYQRPQTRPMSGYWNILGTWSLYRREIHRFSKTYIQNLFAPVITALLFLSIFNLAFEGEGRSASNIPFSQFLIPGLALMAGMTGSFANSSFALMFEKMIRCIPDTLMPPLSPGELTAGYIFASSTRGLLVTAMVGFSINLFVPVSVHSWPIMIFYALGAVLFMSLLGLITSIWAEKIDHVASVNNFIILPLVFLSGTFYSTKHLPDLFQTIVLFNPIFYIIDGFRFGCFGYADGSLELGAITIIILNLSLWFFCVHLFRSGYKLKS